MDTRADIIKKIEDLTDLEFAVLLCLIAKENCLIDTPSSTLDDLVKELILISRDIFGLSFAVIDCTVDTSLEEFNTTILERRRRPSELLQREENVSKRNYTDVSTRGHDRNETVNVIIAKNYDHISQSIQVQTLEMLRTRRIHTKTATYSVPNNFVFIPILASEMRQLSSRLNNHLNEHISISHYHDPSVGFVNLEGDGSSLVDERGFPSSAAWNSSYTAKLTEKSVVISEEEIDYLRGLIPSVTVSTEVYCYTENIINFLRFNRAVFCGITAPATRQFHKMVKCLASLHGVDYAPPSLVALAAKKIYRHRITVAKPQEDRSMMYGSDINAVEKILSSATPDSIVEDVLAEVEAPL
ncbi:hypothetical protein H112_00166 [Trichophyton rubrum D6]|uniref:Magnesium chelatase n=3 Tax=Trichophyton TaxID=5550 RepID=F2T0Z6_TRIRC|nr:uncharacterized protein TERG_08485 [Trichophyton rubrum CBS 118892]EZF27918.1 hypothetical protein H100_00166 [Trichophyton rubrum MR850]EZF46924.1 hypothetical protein H102_00165 [Trichophyton rubrum CBS 100081]EZF57638.1 hypothetical protein H103_00167 [Trichophyton rubrum CBS 288.86]EZF68202.1 hypothetical protein H104_00166 [Trichophyton rubrum CBS 289.86]EZF78910.1 hypothetical protein H105_00157 [Trichophyton soudanense CBS 452.61]EZF89487.1 hypothetical protein H110_00166 [Trichophy